MALFNWDSKLSVNVEEIDAQHKKLVQMINELNDAMKDRKSKEILNNIIHGLIEYTGSHFLTEEKYFDEFEYPEASVHKKEHNDFVKKVSKFENDFNEGRLLLSIDIMEFLKDWLVNHIQGSDKKYTTLFNENGLK